MSIHEMEVSETNLNVIEKPVIPKHCFNQFGDTSTSIMNSETNQSIKSFCHTETVEVIGTPEADSYIKIEEVNVKSEREQEDEWLETNSATARSIHNGLLNITANTEIKTENKGDSNAAWDIPFLELKPEDVSESEEKKTETHSKNHLLMSNVTIDTSTGARIYKCDLCNYTTNHRNCIKIHQVKHADPSEVSMHGCDLCGFKTKYKRSIQMHRLTHRDPSELQMYRCDTCSYESKTKGRLVQHLLVHKGSTELEMHRCSRCTFETKYKNALKKHQLTHLDDLETRIYECDKCEHKSKTRSNLQLHTLVHKDRSEVRMYKCELCDFETKYKKYLKPHAYTHVRAAHLLKNKSGAT